MQSPDHWPHPKYQTRQLEPGSTPTGEWKSHWAPHMTVKLECWVVRALRSFGPQWVAVSLRLVSRCSPYPSVQTFHLGCFRPLPRTFPLQLISSVSGLLLLNNYCHGLDFIMGCQKVSRKSALLLPYTARPGEIPPAGGDQGRRTGEEMGGEAIRRV